MSQDRPTDQRTSHAANEALDYVVSPYRIAGSDNDSLILETASGPRVAIGLVRTFIGLIVILVADSGPLRGLESWSTLELLFLAIGLALLASGLDVITRTDQVRIDARLHQIEQNRRRFGKWQEPIVTPFERVEYIALRFGSIDAGGIGKVRGWSLEVQVDDTDSRILLNAGTDLAVLARLADLVERLTGIPVDRSQA
jgi:hypothetical protein